jgi:hypothetical protein
VKFRRKEKGRDYIGKNRRRKSTKVVKYRSEGKRVTGLRARRLQKENHAAKAKGMEDEVKEMATQDGADRGRTRPRTK